MWGWYPQFGDAVKIICTGPIRIRSSQDFRVHHLFLYNQNELYPFFASLFPNPSMQVCGRVLQPVSRSDLCLFSLRTNMLEFVVCRRVENRIYSCRCSQVSQRSARWELSRSPETHSPTWKCYHTSEQSRNQWSNLNCIWTLSLPF